MFCQGFASIFVRCPGYFSFRLSLANSLGSSARYPVYYGYHM